MKLFTLIIIGLFSVSICNAEIITRSFEVQENNFINIENNTVDSIHSHILNKNEIFDSIVKLQCQKTSIDLAYKHMGFWDNFECGCGGSIYGVTSSQPLYMIPTQSNSIFRTPLDTMDTTMFKHLQSSEPCPLWSVTQPGLSSGVCGPCIIPVTPERIYWFLSKTLKNHYFLFRFNKVDTSAESTSQTKMRAKIICLIQIDGTLDFSKAFKSPVIYSSEKQNHTVNQSHSAIRKVLTSEIASQNGVLYNIQGKRISKSASGTTNGKTMRLYIISNK